MTATATSTPERLAAARLYFVCDGLDGGSGLRAVLSAALEGGVEVLQLRDRSLDRAGLESAGAVFRELATAAGVLFIVNDDARLAAELGADGVHVGQADDGVARAGELAGPGALVGLSTHSAEQLAIACRASGPAAPDYVSVGPIWETPTKPGRAGTGLGYVEHAAEGATLPWFAIGSIDAGNVDAVVAAGASRIVVVRALRDASDPAAVARSLRGALPGEAS